MITSTAPFSSFYYCITLAILLGGLPFAQAQTDTSAEQPLDIFLTGLPFQDTVQDAPLSATALTSEDLERRNVYSLQDTLEQLPGLSFVGGSSRPRFFLVRGVGELEQYEGAPNPSVAVIIDGIDFSGLGLPLPLFDIRQVELLRGPQGMRFGANGLAGALNIQSADPTVANNGIIQLGAGNDDFLSTGAAVSGSIPGTNDTLTLRVSAFHLEQNGFRDNQFLNRDDTNNRDETFARLKLRFEESSDFSAQLVGWVSNNDNGYDAFAIDNSLNTQSDDPGEDGLETVAGALTLDSAVFEGARLRSTTAAFEARQNYSYDGDWGNNPFWEPYAPYDYFSDSDRRRKMYSQELRLVSDDRTYTHGENARWLIGVFAQNLDESTSTEEFADGVAYDFLIGDYRARTGALFSQYELPLSTGTSLTLGVRGERRLNNYRDSRGNDFSPINNMVGGQISLAHDLGETSRAYVSASRGFKNGGFNAGPSVPDTRRVYDPEYLWNYEVGLKGEWFEQKLSANLALFFQERDDQQLKFGFQDDPTDPLSFTYITDSAAKGQSYGLELDTRYRATAEAELFASLGLIDSEFTDVPVGSETLDGRSFSHAPNWQYTTGADLFFTESVSSRIELTGRDRFAFDDSHNQRSEPYYLLHASLAYNFDNFRVAIWGRNLTDENYAVRGFFFGNEPPDFPNTLYIQRGDPRSFGITIRYAFS